MDGKRSPFSIREIGELSLRLSKYAISLCVRCDCFRCNRSVLFVFGIDEFDYLLMPL